MEHDKICILLIERDPTMRDGLCQVLLEDGYVVTTACGQEEVSKKDFDLIIADLCGKDEVCWEVLQRIHRMHPDIPIVVMIPYGDLRSRAKARTCGWVKEVLMKPVAYGDLARALQNTRSISPCEEEEGARKTILVVEDEPHLRMLYERELSQEGYEVVSASDGKDALRKMDQCSPDLVVLDMQLPGMDGLEALGWIVDRDHRVRIIIYSNLDAYRDHFMSWVADAYLTKSADLTPLKNKVKELI